MRYAIRSICLCLAMLLAFPPRPAAAGALNATYPPRAEVLRGPVISADAAVLIDARSGRLLWSRNADQARAPASTTKMMTALVALERGQLNEVIVVPRAAAATPGSSAGLRAGDRYTLAALLRGLLLRSGNDAAAAIATHLAGSEEGFAALMNARARALGLRSTHFVNPHGLTAPFHYSSALDLALIARAGLAVPAFAQLVATADAEMRGWDSMQREIRRELHNTNRLLVAYDWVDGVKTGTTNAAGNCLVASGNRGGFRLIAVVLHSDDRWGDAVRLLRWGYAHFSQVPVAPPGGQALLPVADARDPGAHVPAAPRTVLSMPVALEELPRLSWRVVAPVTLVAPVRRGEMVGRLQLQVAGITLASVPLAATASVPRAAPWVLLLRRLGLMRTSRQ